MKKLSFACLMLFCLFSFQPGCAQKDSAPQYKGFPVYPPENIKDIKESGKETRFSFSLRSRASVIAELAKTQGVSFGETMHQMMLKADDKSSKEFKEAESYIKAKSSKLGWKMIYEGMYKDGGSPIYFFAKKSKKIQLMNVTVWSGMIVCGAGGCNVSADNWGYIDYSYKEYDLPPEYKGFPLLLGTTNVKEYKKSDAEEGTTLAISRNPNYPTEGLEKFPELYGWKLKLSPEIEEREAYYEKQGEIVKADGRGNFIFYSKAAASEIAKKYPEKVYKKEIAFKGCLIFQGKYLRPPYVVEFKDNKVVVNGVIIDPCTGYLPRAAFRSFQMHAGNLVSGIEIGGLGGGLTGRTPMSEGEIKDFITGIDGVVKSKEPDNKKIENLRKLELLSSSPEDSLMLILKNWDGVNLKPLQIQALAEIKAQEELKRVRVNLQQVESQAESEQSQIRKKADWAQTFELPMAQSRVEWAQGMLTLPKVAPDMEAQLLQNKEKVEQVQQKIQQAQAKLKEVQEKLQKIQGEAQEVEAKIKQNQKQIEQTQAKL